MSFWSGALAGVVVGFVASFPVGYLRERGRQLAVRHDDARASKRQRTASEKAADAATLKREEEDRKRREHIEALKNERIGRRFLRRLNSRDEDGVIVTVIDLDQRNPGWHVLVENAPVPGAELPVDLPERLVMDWSRLVEPPEAQMHYTARVLANSHNDADGWLEFEELPQGDD